MNWPLWIDVKVIICRALSWKWNNKDSEGWCWNQGHGYGWEEKTRHCQVFKKKLAQSFQLVCPAIACFGKYLKAAICQQFPITFCSKQNNAVVEWQVDGTFTMWLKGF